MGRSKETFGKKEVRKKNEKKRLEKEKRKQQKKEQGKQSPDDMIAYVDENGMITSTPPDLSKKTEVDVNSIEIQTPKKEAINTPPHQQGMVTKFDNSKGYGFIDVPQLRESVFFHINDCLDEIIKGDYVEFDTEKGVNGLKAKNVKLLK